jgi:hypothetical protein
MKIVGDEGLSLNPATALSPIGCPFVVSCLLALLKHYTTYLTNATPKERNLKNLFGVSP